MGNKSSSYTWTCLFNCTTHAYDVLRNVLHHCEVIMAFIIISDETKQRGRPSNTWWNCV